MVPNRLVAAEHFSFVSVDELGSILSPHGHVFHRRAANGATKKDPGRCNCICSEVGAVIGAVTASICVDCKNKTMKNEHWVVHVDRNGSRSCRY